MASVYPLYEAAREVGGDRIEVRNLAPSGAEPHDLELSPTQVDALLDADVVLYVGRGFQPAVEAVVDDRDGGITVDVLAALTAHLRTQAAEGGDGDQSDPHVWLDPVLMARIVEQVRDALARADPSGASSFERSSDRYRSEIEALHERFRNGLSDCGRRVMVTSHAAFGYLAARYGLIQQPIAGISPEAEPDPRRLAELADLVRREGVTTVFTETLVSPRVANTLAREAGVHTAVLNPVEGLSPEEVGRGENYVSVMDANLRTLRQALECR